MLSGLFRKKIDHLARLCIAQLLASFLLDRFWIALKRLDLRIQTPVFLVHPLQLLLQLLVLCFLLVVRHPSIISQQNVRTQAARDHHERSTGQQPAPMHHSLHELS